MPHRRLVIHQLGSGSSGNATVVSGPGGALLVDAGFSARELLARAARHGVAAESIRAVVLTHAHSDHCRGAGVLARRLRVPLWASAETLSCLPDLRAVEELRELTVGGGDCIAGLAVESLGVSHDAPGTVILRIEGRLGIATDLGTADAEVAAMLSGLEGLLLEFNHDVPTLLAGRDPPWLKQRIRSDEGHLSNQQAGELLQRSSFRPPGRALWLCHLSRRNNRPELALAAAREALGASGDGGGPRLLVTDQTRPIAPVELA